MLEKPPPLVKDAFARLTATSRPPVMQLKLPGAQMGSSVKPYVASTSMVAPTVVT